MLGQTTLPVTTGWWTNFTGDTVKQVMVLLGTMGLVALFVVLWIVFIRKSSGHERRKYPKYPKYPEPRDRSSESNSSRDEDEDDEPRASRNPAADGPGDKEGERGERHHGRRRRTSEHRPRNPTLSETGGLPPLRDPGQPPPQ